MPSSFHMGEKASSLDPVLLSSPFSLVPGQLDGPARRTMFQVALREGNYKMIWGQVLLLTFFFGNYVVVCGVKHHLHRQQCCIEASVRQKRTVLRSTRSR